MPYSGNDVKTVGQTKKAVQRVINSIGDMVDEYIETNGISLGTKALNKYTWAEISAIAQAGQGANYFDIGDWKEITLNGTIGDSKFGTVTLTDQKYRVFILHFNLPENGVADNNIIFGGFKTTDTNADVAIYGFKMNTYSTVVNYGGWKGCDLRHGVLGATNTAPVQYKGDKSTYKGGFNANGFEFTGPLANTLLAAFPADLRNVMRYWKRYVNNTGNTSNTDANVTECIDAISLLAEFEVYGVRTYANQYEQNHQVQMQYYANGNNVIKHQHTSTEINGYAWLSSPSVSTNAFGYIYQDKSAGASGANNQYGLAPAFKV